MASAQDRVVTLFGGDGFVGRYAAAALYKAGARLRIASRDPRNAFFLRTQGGIGQTQFVRADINDADAVAAAVRGSDAVVNLVGILAGDFQSVHVEGARTVAEAAAAAGASAFVHLSAIGADPASASAYGRSKGEGEAAVRAAFPAAVILRPSIVFGQEDNFINRFASMAKWMPVLPVVRAQTCFQPVWAADVGRAIAAAIADPRAHGGRTYELGGPERLSMRDLNAWVARAIGRDPLIVDVPDRVAAAMAWGGGWAPGAPITWDQWLMLQSDNVVADDAEGLEALGVSPTPLAAVADEWLTRFRRGGRFTQARSPY